MSEPKYKLVPVVATRAQIEAGVDRQYHPDPVGVEDVYKAMVLAALSPPQDPRDEALRVALVALELINKKCCGEALPSWDASLQTTVSRGYVADVCDATEYKIKELMGER